MNEQTHQPSFTTRLACMALPYLTAISCALAGLLSDTRDIPPVTVLLETAGIVLAVVFGVHLCLYILTRRSPARELIVFTIVAYVGLFGYIHMSIRDHVDQFTFLAIWSFVFVAIGIVIWRRAESAAFASLASFLLFVTGALVSLQLGWIGSSVWHDSQRIDTLMKNLDIPTAKETDTTGTTLPDIYYVILDAYGRGDVLNEKYDHDNSEFLNSLRERGFFVASKSRSNYHLTELSLASSLNMTYLQRLPLEQFKTRMPLRRLISESTVVQFLKRAGYATVALETGKAETECRSFDRYIQVSHGLNDYQDVLLGTTAVPAFLSSFKSHFPTPAELHRTRITRTFDLLPGAVADSDKPTFVFAHLLTPHPPFVFDEHGDAIDLHGYYLLADGAGFTACHGHRREAYTSAYRNQLTHINNRLLQLVDQIQNNSQRPAIIILQADHGPRSQFNVYTGEGSDFREGFGIMNAICLPGDDEIEFYDSMTPVNTFRLILNRYFDTNLDPLEDRSFFEDHAYSFRDVTNSAVAESP